MIGLGCRLRHLSLVSLLCRNVARTALACAHTRIAMALHGSVVLHAVCDV
jgi:hypothetical protein